MYLQKYKAQIKFKKLSWTFRKSQNKHTSKLMISRLFILNYPVNMFILILWNFLEVCKNTFLQNFNEATSWEALGLSTLLAAAPSLNSHVVNHPFIYYSYKAGAYGHSHLVLLD